MLADRYPTAGIVDRLRCRSFAFDGGARGLEDAYYAGVWRTRNRVPNRDWFFRHIIYIGSGLRLVISA